MVEWKKSTDKNGNEYFYYPAQEEIFKKMTAENEGFILEIYDSANNKLKRKEVNSSNEEWGSPVFTYLKTMIEDKERHYKKYNNCKFYAVPKSLATILDNQNQIKTTEGGDMDRKIEYIKEKTLFFSDIANNSANLFKEINNLQNSEQLDLVIDVYKDSTGPLNILRLEVTE